MKITLLSFLILFSSIKVHSKLLDKVAGAINDKIFTFSEIERIQKSSAARNEIAPFLYYKSKYTMLEILKIQQKIFIIKDKLSETGFIVSDDSVESRIKETETRLGLNRSDLIAFLDTKGIKFNEYFELIRNATEYNIFNSKIILPLVNITEQEIKNEYYKLNSNNEALSFRYDLVDFSIAKAIIKDRTSSEVKSIFEEYQKTGNIPQSFKDISTSSLDNVLSDDLPKKLSVLLKSSSEGDFSDLYITDDIAHIFYIKTKNLTESQDFIKVKDRISNQIYIDRAAIMSKTWFNKEFFNYYTVEHI